MIVLWLLIAGLLIWRVNQKKELFLKLSWAERIYTIFVYLLSMIIVFFGGSKLQSWIRTFELNEVIETSIFVTMLAISLWFIVTLWSKILPKKVLEYVSKWG